MIDSASKGEQNHAIRGEVSGLGDSIIVIRNRERTVEYVECDDGGKSRVVQCAWVAWEKVGSGGRKRCVARETQVIHEWICVCCDAIFYVFVVM
ncbi:hypothetical protein Mapa_000813 [Marchantia paleacea]|nr:hypothetical protein Mapa_000813 [Marchantia paleacea]